MCSGSWSCRFQRQAEAAGLQGTGVPCQVESRSPYWGNSISVLEAGAGGFSDALLGLRRCKTELGRSMDPKKEKRRKGEKALSEKFHFSELVTQSQ